MTREIINAPELISFLTYHYNYAQVARILGTPYQTVREWEDTPRRPGGKWVAPFERALRKMADEAPDGITIETPEVLTRSKKKAPASSRHCDRWLRRRLSSKPRVSSVILDEAKEAGFSRIAVYRSASRLGVIKKSTGWGKSRISRWSLREE